MEAPTGTDTTEGLVRQRDLLLRAVEQAREVQTSLLPREAPALGHVEVGVRSRAAVLVGGDVYDLQRVASGTLAFAVADATGHGLPAALRARDAVIGLRVGMEESLRPARTIEKLHRVLRCGGDPARFISLFYGELDPWGALIYVNAGHPPPLLLRRGSREAFPLRSTGPVLGLPIEGRFEQAVERLDPGDRLVLYTDGLSEARDVAGSELGADRVTGLALAAMDRDLGAVETAQWLMSAAATFTGEAALEDDRTVMVVCYRGRPAAGHGR